MKYLEPKLHHYNVRSGAMFEDVMKEAIEEAIRVEREEVFSRIVVTFSGVDVVVTSDSQLDALWVQYSRGRKL